MMVGGRWISASYISNQALWGLKPLKLADPRPVLVLPSHLTQSRVDRPGHHGVSSVLIFMIAIIVVWLGA